MIDAFELQQILSTATKKGNATKLILCYCYVVRSSHILSNTKKGGVARVFQRGVSHWSASVIILTVFY